MAGSGVVGIVLEKAVADLLVRVDSRGDVARKRPLRFHVDVIAMSPSTSN